MVKCIRLVLPVASVGDTVTIPVQLVDRGRGDPRNLLAVVSYHDTQKDQYELTSEAGHFKGLRKQESV